MKKLLLLFFGLMLSFTTFSQDHRYDRDYHKERNDREYRKERDHKNERWNDDHRYRKQHRVVLVTPHRYHHRDRRPVYITIGSPFCDKCRGKHKKHH